MTDPLPQARTPWDALRRHTPARVALGRTGVSLPTTRQLEFGLAHAQARDAVRAPLDLDAITKALASQDIETLHLHAAAPDRATYLRRPDLGRRLDDRSRQHLTAARRDPLDLAFVVADGLSAQAVTVYAPGLIQRARTQLLAASWRIGPVAIVEQGRVAIGDEIGAALDAALVVVLIGERPGLSAPRSLGLYVTWAPRPGETVDAERTCISNVREDGLAVDEAAAALIRLVTAARVHTATGIALSERLQLGERSTSKAAGCRPLACADQARGSSTIRNPSRPCAQGS